MNIEQLDDLQEQVDTARTNLKAAEHDLAVEMAWAILHEGATAERIAHALGHSTATVEAMISSVDDSEID